MIALGCLFLVVWWIARKPIERHEGDNYAQDYLAGMRYVAPFVAVLMLSGGTYLVISGLNAGS
jgi:hypothetical protein